MRRARYSVALLIALGFVAGCADKPPPAPKPSRTSMEGIKEGSSSRTDSEGGKR